MNIILIPKFWISKRIINGINNRSHVEFCHKIFILYQSFKFGNQLLKVVLFNVCFNTRVMKKVFSFNYLILKNHPNYYLDLNFNLFHHSRIKYIKYFLIYSITFFRYSSLNPLRYFTIISLYSAKKIDVCI